MDSMREQKTDRIQIRVEPTLKREGDALAEKNGRRLSGYLLDLLRAALKKAKANG